MEQDIKIEKILNFDENFLDIFYDILKKYNLKESGAKIIENIKNRRPLIAEVFMEAVLSFFRGSIKENELVILLKEKFNLSEEDSKKLFSEIKEKIIPLVKEVEITLEKITPENLPMPSIKRGGVDIFPNTKEIINETEIEIPEKKINISEKKKERIKKSVTIEEDIKNPPPANQSKKPDDYREPIE